MFCETERLKDGCPEGKTTEEDCVKCVLKSAEGRIVMSDLFDECPSGTYIEDEERKVLYEFYVAGVQHHDLRKCITKLNVNDILLILPEPTNVHDLNAVKIMYRADTHLYIMLGYVPARLSPQVNATMFVKDVQCRIVSVVPENKPWEQLKVAIEEVIIRGGGDA